MKILDKSTSIGLFMIGFIFGILGTFVSLYGIGIEVIDVFSSYFLMFGRIFFKPFTVFLLNVPDSINVALVFLFNAIFYGLALLMITLILKQFDKK